MDLDRYEENACRHLLEVLTELKQHDLEALAAHCRSLGRDRVETSLKENSSTYIEYLRKSPAQRRRVLNALEAKHRPMFLLCVFYHLRCASQLLAMLCRKGINGSEAIESRFLTGQAAAAAEELRHDPLPFWPFWEEIPDPFDPALPIPSND